MIENTTLGHRDGKPDLTDKQVFIYPQEDHVVGAMIARKLDELVVSRAHVPTTAQAPPLPVRLLEDFRCHREEKRSTTPEHNKHGRCNVVSSQWLRRPSKHSH